MTSAAVLFGAACAAVSPARAEPAKASYEIFFGGLHVLNAEAEWEFGAGEYRFTGEAETQGFIGWLNPWKGNTESRGEIRDGKVVPRYYETWNTDNDEDGGQRLVELSYDAEGNLAETLVEPALQSDDRYPLPPDAGKGTLDPLSVIAGLSGLLEAGGRCEGSFAVFDGRKRYDLLVSDAGVAQLPPTDYSIYAGRAHGCRLEYKLLGGHSKKRNKYAETSHDRIVWVARPAPGAPLIPVRLQISTDHGSVMGHLTGFSHDTQTASNTAE